MYLPRRYFIAIVACVCSLVLMSSCDSASDPSNVKAVGGSPVDYGNCVYYFPYTRDNFGNALSKFVNDHPELAIDTMAENGTGAHGINLGYFVLCHKKE